MNDQSMTLNLNEVAELAYWNIRAVMEQAADCIPSPNEIWGYLNELADDIVRLETLLQIPNKMELQ